MLRKSFKDSAGRTGKVGTVVIDPFWGERTVKEIISKGRGGTRVYYFEGGYCPANMVDIIEEELK